MSTLLNKIKKHSKDAAKALEEADIRSDKDIKTLTREDLNELLPGKSKFRLRREVFEIIHKKIPTRELLRQVKEFIPDESFRAALSNNGVLVDYLHILKEMKSHVDQVQDFVDVHINFLEEYRKDTTPHLEPSRGNHVPAKTGTVRDQTGGLSQGAQGNHVPANYGFFNDQTGGRSRGEQVKCDSAGDGKFSSFQSAGSYESAYHKEMALPAPNVHLSESASTSDKYRTGTTLALARSGSLNDQTDVCLLGADSFGGDVEMGSPSGSTGNDSDEPFFILSKEDVYVPYKAVVSGTTFGADQQVLEKVKAGVRLSETNNDQKFTLLFCVISSRVGSDVDAALAEVKDDKPIILVLMHHSHTPSVTTSLRTWAHDGNDSNVVMHLDVFFHEKAQGLVTCRENEIAISQLQRKLLSDCSHAKVETRGQGTRGSENRTGSTSGKDKIMGMMNSARASFSGLRQ